MSALCDYLNSCKSCLSCQNNLKQIRLIRLIRLQEIWLTLAGLGSIISRMGEIEVAMGKLDDFKFQGRAPLFSLNLKRL